MRQRTAAAVLTWLVFAGMPAWAQQTAAPSEAPAAGGGIDEVQALIQRMQERIRHMNEAAAQRDQALQFLEKQVEEATALIGQSSETAESMKERAAALATELEDISKARDVLTTEVSEREQLLRELEQQVAALTDLLGLERPDRHALGKSLEALRAPLATTLAERDALLGRLADSERAREALEQRLAGLGQELAAEKEARTQQVAALERQLEEERETKARELAALKGEVADREQRIAALEQQVDLERQQVRARNEEIAQLNLQLARMRELLGAVDEQLHEYNARERNHLAKIDELEQRLSAALARKIEELKEYRSEFFGRLKRVLADRPDIKIVGDRFVLPAELLFPSGSAQLEPAGRRELEKVALTLKEVAAKIPPDIDWVLRVDGHTDRRPLSPDSQYSSNWELSTARANTVVEFLIAHGIPPERLMVAGFGEFHPVDPGDSEEAYRRNRRIEFKLTQR